MKQFLYMDYDSVNSIIAQSEEGLIASMSRETSAEASTSKTTGKSVDVKGTLGGAFVRLAKVEAEIKGAYNIIDEVGNTNVSKEFVSRTLHDAAFKIAYDNISVKDVSKDCTCEQGEYIKLRDEFEFVDFNYFVALFEKDGIIEFLKKNSAEQIESEAEEEKKKNNANREIMRRAGLNFKEEVRKAIQSSNKEYDDMGMIIKAIKSIIPYTYILVSPNGYLIPLDEEYFRVNPTALGFKYGGKITCVGLLTNILSSESSTETNSVFTGIQKVANDALRMLINSSELVIKVVHPIAVYYDNNEE